jgi:hypothetical protein
MTPTLRYQHQGSLFAKAKTRGFVGARNQLPRRGDIPQSRIAPRSVPLNGGQGFRLHSSTTADKLPCSSDD